MSISVLWRDQQKWHYIWHYVAVASGSSTDDMKAKKIYKGGLGLGLSSVAVELW